MTAREAIEAATEMRARVSRSRRPRSGRTRPATTPATVERSAETIVNATITCIRPPVDGRWARAYDDEKSPEGPLAVTSNAAKVSTYVGEFPGSPETSYQGARSDERRKSDPVRMSAAEARRRRRVVIDLTPGTSESKI
ncbi:MAG TPA: hypothetical protein VGV64_07590 [Thermoplasmata archaeon]|nr:hypothetical protein [Thermoplasmata archaeon]HEV2429686.1 hypothetical protein [Thermoplasmata archaeon]